VPLSCQQLSLSTDKGKNEGRGNRIRAARSVHMEKLERAAAHTNTHAPVWRRIHPSYSTPCAFPFKKCYHSSHTEALRDKTVGFLNGWRFRETDGTISMYPLMRELQELLVSRNGIANVIWIKKTNVAMRTPKDQIVLRPTRSVQAENLCLRRQLALFKERGIQARRIDFATRISLAILARLFEWRDALFVIQPKTMIRWHHAGWRLFWRWKFRPGRPRIPIELRALIRRMAQENPVWGEERIASELLVKLGIQVSPRTVRKFMAERPAGQPRGDQRWPTFLKNHAKAVVACDFFVAVTATFRLLYVFVVIEHGSRRLVRVDVTAHPSADWTLQQLREVVGFDDTQRYLIHDRDSIFAKHLDESIEALGLSVLKTPPRSPKANSICERVIGTIRRECLDWLIPTSEGHLRSILKSWVEHYNRGRPHSSLGLCVPDPPDNLAAVRKLESRHRLREGVAVRSISVLGGLHQEYSLASSDA
jgi:putative transposase